MCADQVSARVAEANAAVAMALPFDDRQDFEDARRGFVGALSPALVEATDGRVAWDVESYSFLDEDCPESVNPSLWRQAQLLKIHGLFEVAPGVYQVRGLDISNMTIVEGDRGVLVIDPLISTETAAAALALYRRHRGERPVTGLLYTHPHVDHFGGARGVVSVEDVEAGRVPVLAPAGFVEHAVSENLYAGPAMSRRAGYMFGTLLDRGPTGQVSASIGLAASTGTITLVPPTKEISQTGQEEVVDGIRMTFQLAPDTEAPVEMNFLFPDHGVLHICENATHNLHNVLTLRGAQVRNARAWAHYLGEAIDLFASRAEVICAGHHWPRWGADRIVDFLATQRDLYAYLHDQTVRLMNRGQVGAEIAEALELPPALEREWHCRGYYGSVSHNAKAIYQRYMGWFDGNPASLWPHPPEAAARRYVEYMGGADAVLERARAAFEEGDLRWVAEVVNHVVYADPDNAAARELQAAALRQLAYGAENATWRNFLLTGAMELEQDGLPAGALDRKVPADLVAGLTVGQILDGMAIRLDGPRAWDDRLAIDWAFRDSGERYAMTLANGVLTHSVGQRDREPDAVIALDRGVLDAIVIGTADVAELLTSGRLAIEGDAIKVGRLLELLDEPDFGFPIVTPRAPLPAPEHATTEEEEQ
ncbi:MAG: alkyl sulfatase dimerization domain-containing protein [Thermoleophilaceae bacterium]